MDDGALAQVSNEFLEYQYEVLGIKEFMYEASNGIVFSEPLEFFGYLLNRIDEPVPVLQAPVYRYLPVSKQRFSAKTGDFVITTPTGVNHFGAVLNIKEYPDGTYPGILNGLKYLDFEYVVTHSFSPMGRQDALKALERTKGMPIPYYGNNPYLFCTIGVPTDCWAPISPMTGAFTVTNPYCFNPVSAGLYATVCPQAFIGGGSASNLGSAPKVAEAGGDAASTDTN